MKYTISNITHEPHEMDDDIIFFYFDIQFTEPEELLIDHYFFPYSRLLDYIEEKHPEFYEYVEQTRKSIDGFGPCEVRTMDALGDESVKQMYDYLQEFLLGSEWVKSLFDWKKNLQSKLDGEQINLNEKAAKAFEKLSEHDDEMRDYQNRYRRFCEAVTKSVRQIATDIYPEITELEPEQLKKFRYLFVSEIQGMHEQIEKLLSEK